MFVHSFARPWIGAGVLAAFAVSALVGVPAPAVAQTSAPVASPPPHGLNPVRAAGKYSVVLRLPADGLYAGEETDVEFRLVDTSKPDPISGATGVIRAKVVPSVTMPAMPSMPKMLPKTHSEGVPGDYGVVLRFPHGGDYALALTITPPAQGAEPFTVTFPLTVKDEDERGKRKPLPPPYTLEVATDPARPVAGQPVTLTLHVRERANGQPVTAFDETHTERMHLVIVRSDLGQFFHEHPKLDPDGTFHLTFTFPTGGEWHLFGDCAPAGAGSQVTQATLSVGGEKGAATHLTPAAAPTVTESGLTLTLKTAALPARTTLPLTFTLTDTAGKPVTDLQPWLGAMAHLILIESDARTFVHSHPDERDTNNGKNGTLTFLARFPKAGVYKGWVQAQREGKVVTLPFVVRATGDGK